MCPTCPADSTFSGAVHVVLREACVPGPLNAWRLAEETLWYAPWSNEYNLRNDATGKCLTVDRDKGLLAGRGNTWRAVAAPCVSINTQGEVWKDREAWHQDPQLWTMYPSTKYNRTLPWEIENVVSGRLALCGVSSCAGGYADRGVMSTSSDNIGTLRKWLLKDAYASGLAAPPPSPPAPSAAPVPSDAGTANWRTAVFGPFILTLSYSSQDAYRNKRGCLDAPSSGGTQRAFVNSSCPLLPTWSPMPASTVWQAVQRNGTWYQLVSAATGNCLTITGGLSTDINAASEFVRETLLFSG